MSGGHMERNDKIRTVNRKKVLITGGAGFVGTNLVNFLLQEGNNDVVVFDKLDGYPNLKDANKVSYFQGNITQKNDIEELFNKYGPFETVFHLAGEMPNKLADAKLMWETNVVGTKYLVEESVKTSTNTLVFISSNVTYGIPVKLPVDETTPVRPLEIYGKSKLAAEQVLDKYRDKINIQIFRCPVITGVGRLGLQAILYGFISDNRKVYVLGSGDNRYQFVDVDDVVQAMVLASKMKGFDIYVIGADEVLSLRQLYKKVIDFAGSTSRIVSLPAGPAYFILSVLDKVNFSPLGVYQITMMGRSIYADTTKIKKKLGWRPKKTNTDTFIENYKWFIQHKGKFAQIGGSKDSPNRSVPKMGILNLIKIFS